MDNIFPADKKNDETTATGEYFTNSLFAGLLDGSIATANYIILFTSEEMNHQDCA